MSFAFTAGSLGDIIAVVTLITDLIKLLDDSKGSVKEYHEVVARLSSQLVAVEQVEKIFGGQAQTTKEAEIQAEVRQILAQIKKCAKDFKAKLEKFRPSFTVGGSNNKTKDILKKVSWKLKREEIEAFETNIATYTTQLRFYMWTKSCHDIESSRDQLSNQIMQSENATATALEAQSKLLRHLQAFMLALGRVLLFKLNQVAQTCNDVQKAVAQAIQMGFTVLPMLQAIICRLDQLTSPLEDVYFILFDHLGGRKKIFLGNILSWGMFYDMLAMAYKSEKGGRRLARQRFLLEQNLSDKEINRQTPWKNAFRPRQVVHLRLDCRQSVPLENSRRCPGCGFIGAGVIGQVASECSNCNLRFFMCLEPSGPDHLAHSTVRTRDSTSPRHPAKYNKNNAEDSDDSDEEDISGLTRIRVLTTPQHHLVGLNAAEDYDEPNVEDDFAKALRRVDEALGEAGQESSRGRTVERILSESQWPSSPAEQEVPPRSSPRIPPRPPRIIHSPIRMVHSRRTRPRRTQSS